MKSFVTEVDLCLLHMIVIGEYHFMEKDCIWQVHKDRFNFGSRVNSIVVDY